MIHRASGFQRAQQQQDAAIGKGRQANGNTEIPVLMVPAQEHSGQFYGVELCPGRGHRADNGFHPRQNEQAVYDIFTALPVSDLSALRSLNPCFGIKNDKDVRKAERFFKERRIKIHFMDFKQRSPSKGELLRFFQKFGEEKLIDRESKRFLALGLQTAYYGDDQWLEIEQRLANMSQMKPEIASLRRMVISGACAA